MKKILLLNIIIWLFCIIPAFSLEAPAGYIPGNINIRQETFNKNGVFVVRPKKISRKIISIIARNSIQSIDDYGKWLDANFKYIKDKKDIWSAVTETLEKGGGDCEDLAFLTEEFLARLGYRSKVIAFFRIG